MRGIDLDKLSRQIEPLTRFFYAMLGVALLAVLFGSPASGLFFLVVGAGAQVLRAAIQELVWQSQNEAAPPLPRRRPTPRPAAERPVARRAAAERQAPRRRTALSR
ncbi:MAG: hypothetical protein ABW065_13860 [Solirubrobacterales bacterium]